MLAPRIVSTFHLPEAGRYMENMCQSISIFLVLRPDVFFEEKEKSKGLERRNTPQEENRKKNPAHPKYIPSTLIFSFPAKISSELETRKRLAV
jgi:hypothetical protein